MGNTLIHEAEGGGVLETSKAGGRYDGVLSCAPLSIVEGLAPNRNSKGTDMGSSSSIRVIVFVHTAKPPLPRAGPAFSRNQTCLLDMYFGVCTFQNRQDKVCRAPIAGGLNGQRLSSVCCTGRSVVLKGGRPSSKLHAGR